MREAERLKQEAIALHKVLAAHGVGDIVVMYFRVLPYFARYSFFVFLCPLLDSQRAICAIGGVVMYRCISLAIVSLFFPASCSGQSARASFFEALP